MTTPLQTRPVKVIERNPRLVELADSLLSRVTSDDDDDDRCEPMTEIAVYDLASHKFTFVPIPCDTPQAVADRLLGPPPPVQTKEEAWREWRDIAAEDLTRALRESEK